MHNKPDYYSILKLTSGATDHEIKSQYRRLARVYHPDRNPADHEWCAEQLRLVNEAFATLSDPARKADYDRKRQARVDVGSPPPAPVRSPQSPVSRATARLPIWMGALRAGVVAAGLVAAFGYFHFHFHNAARSAESAAIDPMPYHAARSIHSVSKRRAVAANAAPRRRSPAQVVRRIRHTVRIAHRTAKPAPRHYASAMVSRSGRSLTSAEKDRRAERLADAIEAAKHGGSN